MVLAVTKEPLFTKAAAVYEWSDGLSSLCTAVSRFDEPYPMWREVGTEKKPMIALPRGMCPVGKDLREVGIPVKFESQFVARSDEQTRVVQESKALLIKGKSFITQAPTGFGKTWCAMDVIAQVGLQTLVVVTKEDVRDQWYEAAKEVLGLTREDVGFIQGEQFEVVGKKLIIGMIQSLSINGRYPVGQFKGIGLTIWDEVHRAAADHFSNSCWLLPSKRRWGLSATPERIDGKEELIYASIGPVSVKTEMMTLVPNVYRVRTNTVFPKMKFSPKALGAVEKVLSHDLRRNHYIASFVLKAWQAKRRTIIFSSQKNHLEYLWAALRKVGVPEKDLAYYVGGLSKKGREEAKVKPVILATYAFTSEATDIPWLDCLVMATPRANVIQIVGRVLREYPDKPRPIVLDLIDPMRIYWTFSKKRLGWYQSIGAKLKDLNYG